MAAPNLRNWMCERFRDVNSPRSIFKNLIHYDWIRSDMRIRHGNPAAAHETPSTLLRKVHATVGALWAQTNVKEALETTAHLVLEAK